MFSLKRRRDSKRVINISTYDIIAAAGKSLNSTDIEAFADLSASVAELGVLQPLSVQRAGDKYELVAGFRRFNAALAAGLTEVPCVVLGRSPGDAGLEKLIESLRREELDVIEQARIMEDLIKSFGLSQEECARQLGITQPSVANRLRLLRLPDDVLDIMSAHGLGERYGRALLRLEDQETQRNALEHVLQSAMNVSAAEEYVESLLSRGTAGKEPESDRPQELPGSGAGSGRKILFVMKDFRILLNTLTRGIEAIQRAGIDASIEQFETEESITLVVKINKPRAAADRHS